ncbi:MULTISPECIES: hypothetical protein [unclassified Olleya]|uniref:hypothetical protein n=1 Tax=unclassified Olleya TaxID=2615019 RepID=UPI000C308E32|nr:MULTISPECIES: hypothetical protein [unclassified Olleya]AUC76498.1 hypothetical protein CW732_12795 [Olleya sp. Bg11-27]QXP58805.1 hypothetical protein H0I26_12895 [Olleya sp. HaHaR_3_96]
MKTKTTILTLFFLTILSISFAQKKDASPRLITGKVSINKYHNLEELNKIAKGDLLDLYIQRIEVLVNILPNIAFATKTNVTLGSLGIPLTKENRKTLEANQKASVEYFDSTVDFQRSILPYSDTGDLIAAILFYEQTLKSLYTYDDFKVD